MSKTNSIDQRMKTNNTIWDNYYIAYQKESNMPGVKYPNEHLVRFIKTISNEIKGKDRRVLELGFGTVANMLMMREYGYRILGLEVSADAVKRAERFIKTNRLEESLEVRTFTGNSLPVKDSSFDIIVGLQCVYYNLDQRYFAKECYRVLKPAGMIFFSFFSPRHGYADYIEGKPGTVVKFRQDHPNPRLKGLEFFLFRSKRQFNEIYGRYFDIEFGLDEFDFYPIFMSWQYLIGKKKPEKIKYFISRPFYNILTEKKADIDSHALEENNRKLWNKKYNLMYKDESIPGNKYPNEYLVRFAATMDRRLSKGFYCNIGKEDEIGGGKKRKGLELLPFNITNLSMLADLNYKAYGLSFSDTVVEKGRDAVRMKNLTDKICIDKLDGDRFPYGDEEFYFVLTEKMGSYFMQQEKLIEETARVVMKDGEIFIGYLSPRHGYMKWTLPLGRGYYRITSEHPDESMRGMVIYVVDKKALKENWDKFFITEIKSVEYNLHRYFSSFYYVKAKKRV